jgi:DNA-directed RNA polymerase subunit RPC12/RpoP
MTGTGTALKENKTLNCSNCGAPIGYVEGESVLTCEHCGSATMLAGFDQIVTIQSHSIIRPKVGENAAVKAARDWLSTGRLKPSNLGNEIELRSVSGRVLPYWIVKSSASTSWRGMNRKSRTVGTGQQKRTEEYWVPADGRFSEDYTWPVYAREDEAEYWGLKFLEPGQKCLFPDWRKFFLSFGMGSMTSPNANLLEGKEPFTLDGITDSGLEIVNGQIVQARAEETAKARIIRAHDDKAKGMATKITDCDTTVTVQGTELVYLPMWEVVYGFGGRDYRMLVNASSGAVVAAEYPVGRRAKIVNFDILFGIIGGLLVAIGFGGSNPGVGWAGIGVLLIAAAFTVLSVVSGKRL